MTGGAMTGVMNDFCRGGLRASGIVVGFLPTAISFGAIAVQAGVPNGGAIAMSVWVFAGASQFAAIEAIRQNLPWLSIVLTVLIINLRHIAMSLAACRLVYNRFPRWQRWLLAHGLVDETFALELSEELRPFPYYLGMHIACWASWVAGTWIGCLVGMQIPDRWLQFALPSLFLYLLINAIQALQGRAIWPVLAAGIALTLATSRSGSMGVLVAILGVAVLATVLLEQPDTAGKVKE